MKSRRPKSNRSGAALGEIQALMFGCIRRPLTRDEEMQRELPDGASTAAVAETFIKPNDRLTSFDRLQIYNQQYWWRLLASFGEDFRGLRAVLGERKFDRLATAYIDALPSRSWTLRNLGERLESFLREHPELTAPRERLALDVARVEWARTVAFDGPSRRPLDPQRLAGRDPADVFVKLQPYIVFLELAHPVDRLLARLKRVNDDQGAMSNAVTERHTRRRLRLDARPSRNPIFLAVHRLENSVYYKRLEPEAHRILLALRKGQSLADACSTGFGGTDNPPETDAAKVREWFSAWMQFGWLC
jgi:hypothetical protein